MIRAELLNLHRILATGPPEDMQAARVILQLLRTGNIHLGLGDTDWLVQLWLEDIGLPLEYADHGYSVWARIPNHNKGGTT